MLKRIIYIILLAQLLLIACSSLGDMALDQDSVENIRKAQEIAKISKDIYDIQSVIQNEDVDFSTVAANFKDFGITEYQSFAEIITDMASIAKSLDDGNLSLDELQEYSRLTGAMILILDSPDNPVKGDYSGSTLQMDIDAKAVTLAEINTSDLDSIEEFKLPDDAILLEHLNLLDSLYYYGNELFNGQAYSRFDNGQIGEFKTIKDGRLSGPAYAWYEDGTYAMQANYLNGYLAGRFIAWSEVGDLVYDIYFDKGQFQSDLQFERDTSREEQEADASEGEGDSEGNRGE